MQSLSPDFTSDNFNILSFGLSLFKLLLFFFKYNFYILDSPGKGSSLSSNRFCKDGLSEEISRTYQIFSLKAPKKLIFLLCVYLGVYFARSNFSENGSKMAYTLLFEKKLEEPQRTKILL